MFVKVYKVKLKGKAGVICNKCIIWYNFTNYIKLYIDLTDGSNI